VGFFEVNINEDDDRAIVIDLANTLGKTHSYIKYGEVGSRNNKDFELIDGVLKIMPGHPAYHKQGAYYVTTHPNF